MMEITVTHITCSPILSAQILRGTRGPFFSKTLKNMLVSRALTPTFEKIFYRPGMLVGCT